MGQYFTPIFLNSTGTIVHALEPTDYGAGRQLAGHSRADVALMHAVEILLCIDDAARLVWAGDDANPERGSHADLYQLAEPGHYRRLDGLVCCDVEPDIAVSATATPSDFGYVCNIDNRQYFDNRTLPIDETGWRRTPLPLPDRRCWPPVRRRRRRIVGAQPHLLLAPPARPRLDRCPRAQRQQEVTTHAPPPQHRRRLPPRWGIGETTRRHRPPTAHAAISTADDADPRRRQRRSTVAADPTDSAPSRFGPGPPSPRAPVLCGHGHRSIAP
jgi:hypothetical protein